MRLLYFACTIALAVAGTMRPAEDSGGGLPHPTSEQPVTSSTKDFPVFPLMRLFSAPNEGAGVWWGYNTDSARDSKCVNWLDVDDNGGISSLESYHDYENSDYFCLCYKLVDCHWDPNGTGHRILFWKNQIHLGALESGDDGWNDVIRSSRCHHGPDPWTIPSTSGGLPEVLDRALFQEITSEGTV